MSISFATNLATLRKEKNVTQKEASEGLGISQALLSHYEKGIRECNLDFVVKAAQYYDVSTDYLLGASKSKHNISDLSDESVLASDSQIKTKTIMRSINYLLTKAENENETSEMFFNNYFSLSIKKYISIIQKNNKQLSQLCDVAVSEIKQNTQIKTRILSDVFPECLKTVEKHANDLIAEKIKKILE